MSKYDDAVKRLAALHDYAEEHKGQLSHDELVELQQQIMEAQADVHNAGGGRLEPEGWMLITSVLLVLLGACFGGWEGVGLTVCPLAVFWIVFYGIIWKIILDK